MNTPVYPVRWQNNRVLLIDQNRLPNEYTHVEISRVEDMAEAISTMIVRGAPITTTDREEFLAELVEIGKTLRATRPTAVNLFWAIDRMERTASNCQGSVAEISAQLLSAAQQINAEDIETCQAIGAHGLSVLPSSPAKLCLLTHCNAGALATAGYGTALGVVRSAWTQGRLARIYADETRPRLQGAKLTSWECVQEGIPVTVIGDSMAAHCMKQGLIDAVVVGADRIAANGDAANKIGTYSLALVAKAHNIPFFVAAPRSTIDFSLSDGSLIPIEERHPSELYQIGETIICPPGVEFYNPAFDVTPAHLIQAIITEFGAFPPAEIIDLKTR
jgi:methylthioribose-1-phosphate isomerase